MSKLVKLKSINVHPEYHEKLLRLANDNYRSISNQLKFLIDREYNNAYSFEGDNLLRLKEEE